MMAAAVLDSNSVTISPFASFKQVVDSISSDDDGVNICEADIEKHFSATLKRPSVTGYTGASRKSMQLSRDSTLSGAITERTGLNDPAQLVNDGSFLFSRDTIRKLKSIGEGAFAEVHLAEIDIHALDARPSTPVIVAVKNLKSQDPDDILDFIHEACLLKDLDHEHIIKFFGAGTDNPTDKDAAWKSLYMVCEYANGGSLKNLLMRQMISYSKSLYTFQDAMRWCLNIAEAITFMHSQSPIIIHRDLKCDNILLAGEKGHMVAKIADFGLHARVDAVHSINNPNINEAELTRYYELTGKTGAFIYMAPEVLQSKPYNEKVDVFSFGVIMYELFSKTLIAAQYMNTTEYDESMVYAERVAAGYRPAFPAFMPEPIKNLIDECWKSDPKLRPTMKNVLVTLKEIDAAGVVDSMSVKDKKAGGSSQGCCTIM